VVPNQESKEAAKQVWCMVHGCPPCHIVLNSKLVDSRTGFDSRHPHSCLSPLAFFQVSLFFFFFNLFIRFFSLSSNDGCGSESQTIVVAGCVTGLCNDYNTSIGPGPKEQNMVPSRG